MAALFVDVVAYLIHVNINSWDILIATSNTFILRKRRIGEKNSNRYWCSNTTTRSTNYTESITENR
jgi:hypothetical protein